MPDSQPFHSIRSGYDEPPASSESSTPRTRRQRLHHALRATEDMAANDMAEMAASPRPPPPPAPATRPPQFGLRGLQRRRQRSPGYESRDAGSDDSGMRRRAKRRRLDSDSSSLPVKQPIKYGHFGQVEPGRLKLEIISCDGGEHRDPRHPNTYLGSQNLLRHDKSVYCSDSPSSSIVLRHGDDTPFCLEKLHIVGPEHGFSAPVREGLVYVSMTLNDLAKYMNPPQHARLRGVHSPPYQRRRNLRVPAERITLSDALRDPEVSAALFSRDRSYADRADAIHDLSDERYYSEELDVLRENAEPHCDIPPATDTAGLLDDGGVPVTLLSDEEPGPEDSSSQEVLDFRLTRLRNMRRRYEDSWDPDRAIWAEVPRPDDERGDDSWNLRRLDAMMARSRVQDSPRRDGTTSDDARERSDRHYRPGPEQGYGSSDHPPPEDRVEGTEFYDDGLNDPNVTRARFHIRRGKYKVAIKFDPPVSGRFILLKLWANRGNVDVQSVIAKGFGGSRFFPAFEFR